MSSIKSLANIQVIDRPDPPLDDPDRVLAEAEKAGVDLMRLRRNLELSPDERLDQFLRALAWLEWAAQARRRVPS
ncbi:MAG: hypothetical protein HY023_17050 [Chloroflexi bacterium]|nr:hypothetical protein [Chloroflexota bacterium]